MEKWNLIIDVERCFDCNLCTLACHDEYVGNAFPGYAAEMPKHGHRWIDILRKERGAHPMIEVAYLPTTCNHCDDAPCVKAGKGAVIKREDGIVIIVPERAGGRKDLVSACPYGAIWWNEERQLPQAWPFDAHLIDQGWTQTRGAQVCPTGAMRAIKVSDEEMARRAAEEKLEVLHPEYGTRPRVYYRNLHRFEKAFLGGSLAAEVDGVEECIAGATVWLASAGRTIRESESDMFGDFRFDGLDPGTYRLEIRAERFPPKALEVAVKESVVLGTIRLC